MVPGIAAVQDVLKVLFESELGAESNSYKFYLRVGFSVSPCSCRLGSAFLESMDLENMTTLIFWDSV